MGASSNLLLSLLLSVILFSGIIAVQQAYADEQNCIDETLTGTINADVTVPTQSSFNICVIDGATINGNIIVEENAVAFVYDGSTINGNVDLTGTFSALNFEGVDISSLNGNINAIENTYLFLESLNMNGNVNSEGEVFISSTRFSGPVTIDGDVIINGQVDKKHLDETVPSDEFVIAGGTITGKVNVFRELSVRIFDAEIGGDLKIKFSENTSENNSLIDIHDSSIGNNLEIKENSLSTIMVSNNVIGKSLKVDKNEEDSVTIKDNTIGDHLDVKENVGESITIELNEAKKAHINKNTGETVVDFNVTVEEIEVKENENVLVTNNVSGKSLKVEKNEGSVTIKDNTVGDHLDVKENVGGSITIELNEAKKAHINKNTGETVVDSNVTVENMDVKENENVSVTNNVIGKDLKIEKNTICEHEFNTVIGTSEIIDC